MSERVEPMVDVNAIWERETSVYPDIIRISMRDGRVVCYRLDVEQPHPSFLTAMELLERLEIGYQHQPYKGQHEKKEKKPDPIRKRRSDAKWTW